jgi:hypothetical protein
MMFTFDDGLDVFFTMLRQCVQSITLPTGKSLIPAFIYASGMFVVSLICQLIHVFSVINWKGALIAALLLLVLVMIERRESYEISRLYSAVKSGTLAVKGRAAGFGAAYKAGGSAVIGDKSEE